MSETTERHPEANLQAGQGAALPSSVREFAPWETPAKNGAGRAEACAETYQNNATDEPTPTHVDERAIPNAAHLVLLRIIGEGAVIVGSRNEPEGRIVRESREAGWIVWSEDSGRWCLTREGLIALEARYGV